jgi:hypothetical protein
MVWSGLPSFSEREEMPMTLQIGMVCGDEFAIVGDTWKHMPSHHRSWFGYSGPKMVISPSGKSVGAIARNVNVSFEAVKEVFTRLEGQSGNKEEQIREIGSRIAQEYDVEFFVAFTDPHPEMYFFQKEKNGRAKCELMYGCYPIGDAGNPAYYWLMRYSKECRTVEDLVKVGALCVVTGAKVNPAMIQDLEVATFDKNGLRIWGREESARLMAQVEGLDVRIGALVLNPGVS